MTAPPLRRRLLLLLAAAAVTTLTTADVAAAAPTRRLNLLFLASDDLRPQLNAFQPEGWVGRHAPPVTPHIDALANRSMVFLRSYCQQAICMATRASLLTGRRPDTTRITVDLGSYWRTRGGNFTSLPQHFRENGYTTVGHGKVFHCGPCSGGKTTNYTNPGPQHPTVQGDDYPYAWTLDDPELLLNGYYHAPNELYSVCSAAPGYGSPCAGGGMGHRTTPSFEAINASIEAAVPLVDQQLADKAIHTLGTLANRSRHSASTPPWFVAVGFHLPHLPDLVPQRFVDLYPSAGLPDNDFAPNHMPAVAWSSSDELNQYSDVRAMHASGAINVTRPANWTRELRRHYYGAVSYLDHNVGRVLTALKENKQEEDAIVVFWGDHGYQLGEHGIYCKVTNFEDAVHTVLIISWPGQQHVGHSKSYVEFVDIFPTLSDLAGIPVPPLCPENSSKVALCTEGVSLRPIFSDPTHEVKRAAFSQYPHRAHVDGSALSLADTRYVTIGDERVEDVTAELQGQSACPTSVLGTWVSSEVQPPKQHSPTNNVFVFRNLSDGGVTLDISGCHQCSFSSATGHQTATGVTLALHFQPPSREVDAMVGTLRNGTCELDWSTNSTSHSGHWKPWYRQGHQPAPAPGPPPPPPIAVFMGYTIVTRLQDGVEYRYTEWPKFIGVGNVEWAHLAGRELYNHSSDPEENQNVVVEPGSAAVAAELSKQLRVGWRGALIVPPYLPLKSDDEVGGTAPHLSSLRILNNTDFPSNCVNPYAPSTSIEMCADLCIKREDCVATIFGGAGNPACAFKCRSDNRVHKDGITATIVRPGQKPTCAPSPPHPGGGPAAPFTPPSAATDPDWLVRYEGANLLHADAALDRSLFPYIGNGYLATHPVSGKVPAAMSTIFVSGVFNGIAVQSPCKDGYCTAPYRASIPTYRVQPSGVPLLSGRFALDLEKATLARRLRLDETLEVEERWYAHLVQRQLLVHEITLNNSGAKSRAIPVQAVAGTADLDPSGSFVYINLTSNGVHTVFGAANHSERPELQRTQVAVASNAVPVGASLSVGANAVHTHYFISAVATSLDTSDPRASAEQALHTALAPATAAGLRASHELAWKARWDQGRVEVEGNLGLAQAINSSLYFLLSSVRADWPMGMSPGGLASDGYNGHTFWDQEYWMVPSLILMQPDSARSCLQYRMDRIAGAVSKARSQGYAGLMWPCESAYSGYEVQGSAGNGTHSETERGIGGEGDYGLYEQHWNSDISFAAWQYWQASGNVTDLKLHLEPMLRGTAEYWVSRVEVTKGRGGPVDGLYHINHVMPPDEYVDGVDDAIFTNFGAATILRKAVQASLAAGRAPGANWTEVASKIFLNFDAEKRYHPEYTGYVPGVRAPPGERNGGGSTLVKQADAILMGFPYDATANNTNHTMSDTVRKNDLEIYSNFTDKGSVAMTWGMFAVGWLETGEQAKAEEAFLRGYANIKSPFGVWTETPTGGTVNFITGAGGFMQSVVFGYGGLRLREDRLDLLQPPLPRGTNALTLRGIHYRGNKLLLQVTATDVSVEVMAQAGSATELDLCLSGAKASALIDGKACHFTRGVAASIRPAGTC